MGKTFEEKVQAAGFTSQEIRRLAATYNLGVAVGELASLGVTEADVRTAFEGSLAAVKLYEGRHVGSA